MSMTRLPRLVVPNHFYHLTHRGNNKKRIFSSNEDRRRFLFWFEEARQKWGVRVLAYCLMDNHVHYVAIPDRFDSFAKLINVVHRRYAVYVNQRNETTGHLWEGRYYSCLLDTAHLIAALRYVERNPVRASMVNNPWDWVWSSARHRIGKEKGYIHLEEIDKFVSISSWRNYIGQSDEEVDLLEIRKQTMAQMAWANQEYKELMEKKYGVHLIPKPRGRRPDPQEN